ENTDAFVVKIEVLHVHRGQLGETNPRAVKQFENGRVAMRGPRGGLFRLVDLERFFDQFENLLLCQDDGQLLLRLRKLDPGKRIHIESAPSSEILIKTPQCRKMQA